jgi:hypothetical protein
MWMASTIANTSRRRGLFTSRKDRAGIIGRI